MSGVKRPSFPTENDAASGSVPRQAKRTRLDSEKNFAAAASRSGCRGTRILIKKTYIKIGYCGMNYSNVHKGSSASDPIDLDQDEDEDGGSMEATSRKNDREVIVLDADEDSVHNDVITDGKIAPHGDEHDDAGDGDDIYADERHNNLYADEDLYTDNKIHANGVVDAYVQTTPLKKFADEPLPSAVTSSRPCRLHTPPEERIPGLSYPQTPPPTTPTFRPAYRPVDQRIPDLPLAIMQEGESVKCELVKCESVKCESIKQESVKRELASYDQLVDYGSPGGTPLKSEEDPHPLGGAHTDLKNRRFEYQTPCSDNADLASEVHDSRPPPAVMPLGGAHMDLKDRGREYETPCSNDADLASKVHAAAPVIDNQGNSADKISGVSTGDHDASARLGMRNVSFDVPHSSNQLSTVPHSVVPAVSSVPAHETTMSRRDRELAERQAWLAYQMGDFPLSSPSATDDDTSSDDEARTGVPTCTSAASASVPDRVSNSRSATRAIIRDGDEIQALEENSDMELDEDDYTMPSALGTAIHARMPASASVQLASNITSSTSSERMTASSRTGSSSSGLRSSITHPLSSATSLSNSRTSSPAYASQTSSKSRELAHANAPSSRALSRPNVKTMSAASTSEQTTRPSIMQVISSAHAHSQASSSSNAKGKARAVSLPQIAVLEDNDDDDNSLNSDDSDGNEGTAGPTRERMSPAQHAKVTVEKRGNQLDAGTYEVRYTGEKRSGGGVYPYRSRGQRTWHVPRRSDPDMNPHLGLAAVSHDRLENPNYSLAYGPPAPRYNPEYALTGCMAAGRRILVGALEFPLTAVSQRADVCFFHRENRRLVSPWRLPNSDNQMRVVEDACIVGPARDTAIVAFNKGERQLMALRLLPEECAREKAEDSAAPHPAWIHATQMPHGANGLVALAPDLGTRSRAFFTGGKDRRLLRWKLKDDDTFSVRTIDNRLHAVPSALAHFGDAVLVANGKSVETLNIRHPMGCPRASVTSTTIRHIHVDSTAPSLVFLEKLSLASDSLRTQTNDLEAQIQLFDVRAGKFQCPPVLKFGHYSKETGTRHVRGEWSGHRFARGFPDGEIMVWDIRFPPRNKHVKLGRVLVRYSCTRSIMHTVFNGDTVVGIGGRELTHVDMQTGKLLTGRG
ncbi:hypothetical protein FISHEDRAFT_55084 [Fistulina hepatica ATCC 64428]|uniref:WD40 repeat-like protein n=1 Tax=Fistulina hepatica ATCC 64428 TaxID=1128425 RepID=A0A0D7ARU4_9AGAR|nr:hypothetical protein FISHEDRAFT_55084 [Fistulina hepatica ATCC 64428]